MNVINLSILTVAFLTLFGVAEIAHRFFNISAERTRKFVHVMTGIFTMSFPWLLESHWSVLLLCGGFFIILLLSMKFGFLASINAVERKTAGSLLYPVIVYSGFLIYGYYKEPYFYYLPILILALCDPLAAWVGKKWPIGRYLSFGYHKTLSGSFAFMLLAMAISFAFLMVFSDYSVGNIWLVALSVGFVSTFAEAITHGGYDNLTIPFSIIIVLLLLRNIFVII